MEFWSVPWPAIYKLEQQKSPRYNSVCVPRPENQAHLCPMPGGDGCPSSRRERIHPSMFCSLQAFETGWPHPEPFARSASLSLLTQMLVPLETPLQAHPALVCDQLWVSLSLVTLTHKMHHHNSPVSDMDHSILFFPFQVVHQLGTIYWISRDSGGHSLPPYFTNYERGQWGSRWRHE